MKNLFLAALTATTIGTSNAACIINAQQKTAKAKTLYVNGTSISKKVREALSSQCKFNVSVMTKAEQISFAKAAFARKLERLSK